MYVNIHIYIVSSIIIHATLCFYVCTCLSEGHGAALRGGYIVPVPGDPKKETESQKVTLECSRKYPNVLKTNFLTLCELAFTKEVRLTKRLSSWKMESVTRVQIEVEAVCISLCANPLGKDMNWLTIWDKVKSTVQSDWCTRRGWPLNCMTVISARWQSNMPLQRQRKWHIPMASYGEILSGRLNYYITRWRHEVSYFGDQTRWWQDTVEKARTQQSGPPGLRLSSSGERESHNADGHKSGGQYVAVLFGL